MMAATDAESTRSPSQYRPTDGAPEPRLPERRDTTPLLLARNAVIVTVHFCAGAMVDEPCRFGAGVHLRAVYTAVTDKVFPSMSLHRRRSGYDCARSDWLFRERQSFLATLEAVVAERGDSAGNQEHGEDTHPTRPFRA